ncbi:hypothetical protein HLB44_01860 [Aquincola sp. S2]|uniref:Uncharacterized protein n=1 Tax=Pseudaquabacterium terrae TaxID=2732868 RepID=A0ABX2EAE7_9BURK|nr:hypothetical protein [Aquabacterium terrae]NRF65722.1 hypothetical protein [Aquabacterium terrae]
MSRPPPDAAAHTLLVRLWKERRAPEQADGEPVWRGTVSDLQGHELGSFASATELVGLIGRVTGVTLLLQSS